MLRNSRQTSKTGSKRAKRLPKVVNGKVLQPVTGPKAGETPKSATTAKENGKKAHEAKTPKHPLVKSGDLTRVSEQVGLHWSSPKEGAPKEGQKVTAVVGKHEIPLVVKVSKPKVDGSIFVMAFLCEKGKGHHKILGENKGEMATVKW